PLDAGHAEAVTEEGRERDDAAVRLVGEAEKETLRVDGSPLRVGEIGVPDDVAAFGPMSAEDLAARPPLDDRQLEWHGYSTPAAQAGLKPVSRYGVPRSAHRNSTLGRVPCLRGTIRDAYRFTAA